MFAAETLEKVLQMYGQYYKVKRDEVAPPFAAEAESSVVDELLSGFKTVKISSAESREIVFFAAEEELTAERAQHLTEAAWAEGLSRVRPGPNHRNTDVILVGRPDRSGGGGSAEENQAQQKLYAHLPRVERPSFDCHRDSFPQHGLQPDGP